MLAQHVPEVEPNNTVANAQPITMGIHLDATLVAGEEDWFSFTLPAATRIRIHTSGTSVALPAGIDTRVALLDATGTTHLAVDDDSRGSALGWCSDMTLNVAAGSYTVRVGGFDPTIFGTYSLELSEIPLVVYDGSEVEPNDSYLTASPTGALPTGATRLLGNLAPNTVVFSDSTSAPLPPVVYSGTVAGPAVVYSGTVGTAASTTTTTQTLPLSQPMANPPLTSYTPGMYLTMTSGPNVGLSRLITSNTATSIAVSPGFPVANTAGSTFDIVTGNTTTVTWTASLPLSSLYIGSGYNIRMTSGANVGLSRLISANTGPAGFGSEITAAAFPVANALGDTFDIDCIGSATVFTTTSPLVPNAWNPATGGNSLGHYHVRFTSGANAGLYRLISGNTGASITLTTALTAVPTPGDTFVVEQVDADYWQVVLTAPFTGVWFQLNEGTAPAVHGYRLEAYNAAGNGLLPATSIQNPAFGTIGTNSTTVPHVSAIRVWPAGTYYLAVRNLQTEMAAPTNMPGSLVPSGNYMFEIHTMPMDVAGTVAETEPIGGPNANNTAATATPIAPGQIGQGNVTNSTGADPSDWWGPIVITSPTTITYQTRRAATATPMADTTINLRDSTGALALASTSGNILDVPSTSTSGLHGRATVNFLVPATYYIEVISPGTTANQTGDYELEVSLAISTPYATATYIITAANGSCGVAPFPTLTRQFASEVPVLGALFTRQLTNCPAGAPFLLMQGLSNTAANGGATPLPFDLTGYGAPLCTINVDPLVTMFGLADGTGAAELLTLVPGDLSLRGFFWFEQAFVLNPAANTLGAQVSNYARVYLGERTW